MSKKILIVFNPMAGRGSHDKVLNSIKASMPEGLEPKFLHIKDFNQFKNLYEFDLVAAVGGDGTVNSVASRLQYGSIPLAIIPAGSGDGFARHFGIPKDVKAALEIINTGRATLVDSGDLSGRFFINIAGTGFEAEVAHEFGKYSARGLAGYAKIVIQTFTRHHERTIELTVAEKKKEINYFSISIANGSQWGNNFSIAGLANAQDNQFEIAVMRKPKWYQIPGLIKTLLSRQQVDSKLITYYRASELFISNSSTRWHIDGEPIELEHKNKISCLPNSILVILPK